MNKWLIFGGGVVTGVVLMFLVLFLYGMSTQESAQDDSGLTLFDEPGEVIESRSFKVFQALGEGSALVNAENPENEKFESYKYVDGLVCLLVDMDKKMYYDEEIVTVPEGKVARQIGVYQYETNGKYSKTVPVIRIE